MALIFSIFLWPPEPLLQYVPNLFRQVQVVSGKLGAHLRGPAAILFIPRDTCSDTILTVIWVAANGGVTNGGLRGVWPPFPEIGRNRPFPPFFCLFRPFPEGLKSTWKIQKTEEKGLFPHVLAVLVFWSWVLLLPRLPPSSQSLRLLPWASILLYGPWDIAWICCPQLHHHPCKNGTHSTCFYSTGGHAPIVAIPS